MTTFDCSIPQHPDEQTGEDRLMHGLAKMRELDLRLARTTQKARELRRMARDAAEEAERAAGGGLAQVQNKSVIRGTMARVSLTSTQHGSL